MACTMAINEIGTSHPVTDKSTQTCYNWFESDEINSPNIQELIVQLYPLSEKWIKLACQLGISEKVVGEVAEEHSNYPDRCLVNILEEWLSQGNGVSWSTVIDALKSSELGEDALANHIQQEYF